MGASTALEISQHTSWHLTRRPSIYYMMEGGIFIVAYVRVSRLSAPSSWKVVAEVYGQPLSRIAQLPSFSLVP